MTHFELLAPDETASASDAEPYRWPRKNNPTNIRTNLDWNLDCYGEVSPAAADLFHIAAAAYLIDLRKSRPTTTFGRELTITVHVHHPALWQGPTGQLLTDLLAWLTGDQWTLLTVPIGKHTDYAEDPLAEAMPDRADTMLLSGGLDSFCGAVDHLDSATSRLHIGHVDAATSVQHAQRETGAWFRAQQSEFAWARHEFRPRERKKESTTRTRSLLFMTMAVAAADGTNATRVVVPENGYTSLNPPLVPSRGGALSTKSTHPWTFHILNRILDGAAIDITVENPYLNLTKGELLAKAAHGAPDGFLATTADTLSCAKLDSGRVKKIYGGDPNINCGLCYACLVRRGAYNGANLTDPTEYLIHRLKGPALNAQRIKRRDDLWALDFAEQRPLTVDDLLASAAWPPGYDLDQALDLANRGRQELFSVPR